MKLAILLLCLLLSGFTSLQAQAPATGNNPELEKLFQDYYQEGLKLSPVGATFAGENRYNHLLPIDFTDSYHNQYKSYFTNYLAALAAVKRESLSENDKLSYDIFKWQLNSYLEMLSHKSNRIPFTQFTSMASTLAQLGSGTVVQPFKTVKDYNNWISRASVFPAYTDSAIVYFRKGMDEGIVLPQALVVKMLPQLASFLISDPTKSVFYGPIHNLPESFSAAEKEQLTGAYVQLINEQLVPAYKKLHDFLQTEYLPKARTTSGQGDIPGGAALYRYNVRRITTTSKTPDEIYNTGLSEVKRIRVEMEKIKKSVGFKGDLNAFFEHMRTDPKFFPYKTPEEVLIAYRAMQQKIEPELPKMFLNKPKTTFEVRQTESFRAASAAAQYVGGLPDGSRPGIFYVPIVDAAKMSFAEESLFAHEAIPGHHYQIMLQKENENLPDFRQQGGFAAYIEGWGLYAESLGKELGFYTDPYQHMAALKSEMHRAIRLVVDPGLHTKGWTREKAIAYMMANEPISEQKATAEIERYMAIPGQALAYKVGELKILDLRKKYTKQLGSSFNIAAFHNELLKDGAMPLDVLEQKMDAWAMRQKK